ncbi:MULTISPECIES: hypothetical protein [Paenarthrobacter]|jgi:hypothetical protein|uniref:hypothetical protein n=1 Tax=Paenarthrobacter TaxID=1742992 RepID=UPI0018789DCB|nr:MULTISPECIES: hypothetical protein [Paenarthrobacter]QOT17544.1 hypothetical protein HMI59_13640 [Paenarthrobacter sp. YJN-5]UOD82707.1 hypothetical protein MQZ73_07620 [Paenarthrobacter ureafaciens]WNZ02410.1 hypothetical protein PVT25_12170 [Paenarthrobacter ureafaciens]
MSDPTVPGEAEAVVRWPGVPEETHDPAVDRALGFLAGIPDAAVADHVDIYAAVHDSLLEALDAEPGLPPAAPRETSLNPEGTN